MMHKSQFWWASLALRVGIAFAFLYPAINAFFNPDSWIGYFPPFLRGYVPDPVLLHAFGAVEIVIALWILSGKKVFWPSLAATGMLVGIVAFNMNNFEVVFRDLAIAGASLSLALATYRSRDTSAST